MNRRLFVLSASLLVALCQAQVTLGQDRPLNRGAIDPACPLQLMTRMQIGEAMRDTRDNIVNAIDQLERPLAGTKSREALIARLNYNKRMIDWFMNCKEFQ